MEKQTAEQLTCYHCGDTCREEHLHFDDKDFCCHGCKAVYGLLQESGLCDYYELTEQPGVKEVGDTTTIRAELFDLPEVREKLVEYSEDGITRVKLHVPQMHCSSCIWLLENLQRVEPAIIRSRVRFTSKELSITFREERFSLRQLVELLRRIGYAPLLSGSGKAESQRGPGVPRMLYIKLGVAGFAFGNIMLFSFPEYLGADTSDPQLMKGFQFLNFLFSLPVLFFSSTGFFTSAWAGLRNRTVNIDFPIALGIIALFSRSVWDVLTGYGPGYFDSLGGLIFFLLLGRWYQAYTYQAMSFDRSLNDFLPLVVLRKSGEQEEPVSVGDLKQGDHIVVRDQELIPVDGVLRQGTGNIDNSFITGEPLPVRRNVGDTIRAGGRQRGAAIELEVLRPFQQSHLKRLWEEHSGTNGTQRPAMPKLIDGVAKRFTVAVILISVAAGLYWAGRDMDMVWPVVTAVLIVACPCALALSMPFAYGHAMRLLGKAGLYLRDSEVVERLSRIDQVVFDKTGTLTAREAYELRFTGRPLTADEARRVHALARNSTHPLSAVLAEQLRPRDAASDALPVIEVHETPGQGIEGTVQGLSLRIGSAAFASAAEQPREAGEAHVHIAIAGIHRGHFVMRKRARHGMADTVEGMRALASVGLLTGDATVDPEVQRAFRESEVRTACTPPDKAAHVRELQEAGRRVLMVGDGLNDAGALQQSDVGISVSETSAALTPASDAILDAQYLHRLPGAMLLTRRAHRIVIASLAISLTYNITGVSFAVAGKLTPLIAAILMPLSSVTVVGFVTIAIGIAARQVGLHSRN
ncbi:MAG: heavy metal translocating P-type ATPase metal-binding domain-containing protein [Flavobacteriales bacterium]|nr:heavy metal translocating P-type ATPase metal-binding domain-containing protein [Flavobacteriales bacterium]